MRYQPEKVQQIPIRDLKQLPNRVITLIVTFRPSPHYNLNIYRNENVEDIVRLLLGIQQERMFIFLLQGILDLNVDDAESWRTWVTQAINARADLDSNEPRQAVSLLYGLKRQFGDKTTDYLSAIVPKYVLVRLEQQFQVSGAVDVCVCIQKKTTGGRYVWNSSQRQGSNSVDAAVWNDLNQEGACYECKLAATIKQDQIDLLSCIWHESDQKLEVGLASFASVSSIQKCLLNFNVPDFVKIVPRNEMLRYWSL